jgi:hypothetical protein
VRRRRRKYRASQQSLSRTIFAFIIAPLAPTIAVAILFDWRDALFYLAVFGYPAVIFIGGPAHLVLRVLGWSGGFIYIAAGFVAGVVSEFLYGIGLALWDTTPLRQPLLARLGDALRITVEAPELALVIGGCGALAGLTFWFVIAPGEKRPPW